MVAEQRGQVAALGCRLRCRPEDLLDLGSGGGLDTCGQGPGKETGINERVFLVGGRPVPAAQFLQIGGGGVHSELLAHLAGRGFGEGFAGFKLAAGLHKPGGSALADQQDPPGVVPDQYRGESQHCRGVVVGAAGAFRAGCVHVGEFRVLLQSGQSVPGQVDQVGCHSGLVGGAGVQPPLAGHGDHAHQHLRVHAAHLGAEAAAAELLGQDVLHIAGNAGEQGGEGSVGL